MKDCFIQLFLMFFWLAFLEKSDSYYVVYLFVGVLGILCLSFHKNEKKANYEKFKGIRITVSSVFSLAVIGANYKLFSEVAFPGGDGRDSYIFLKMLQWLIAFSAIFLGGMFHMFYILEYMERKFGGGVSWKAHEYRMGKGIVFGSVMFLIMLVNITALFLCYYPGMLTADSIYQITQILNGVYSNHHPFYHTMVISFWLKIGMRILGNINDAVAVYSIFSIVFMASAFAYVSLTIYQMKINKKIMIAVTLVYTLMPYHICYSMTMWKDIMFGAWMLIFVVSLFRYMVGIGNRKSVNTGILAVSAMGICLFRSNGYFVFIIIFIAFVVLFGKQYKKIGILFFGIIIVSYILKHPVLECMGVTQPDTVESLSIPAQQIARVVTDCNDLTYEQKEWLSEIVELNEIPNVYKPYISDPVKELVRTKGNQFYLAEHKSEYLKLYIQIGLSHPIQYIEAWIDQTKGYWNGGNDYWIWNTGIQVNTIGIERISNSKLASMLMEAYLWYFENIEVLKLFLSIGLHTWITVLIGYMGYVRNNKKTLFLTVLVLSVIVSLLVATPVYSEFRYAYAVFCCIPFLAVTLFFQ